MDKQVEPKDGVEIKEVNVSTFELAEGQSALIVYPDGVSMVTPYNDSGEAMVTRAVLFTVGLYFASADQAFVEKMVRFGIDKLREGGMKALQESQGIPA